MTEHLVGRQDQLREAQVHAIQMSDWKGWSQDPTLTRPHLSAGSGGEGFLLEIPALLRSSKGKQIFFHCFYVYGCCTECILTCCSLGLCCSAVSAVCSIAV